MQKFVTVAKVGEIPEGEGRAFELDDKVVAVFNDGGEYRAIDDMCPHMGASLASGWLEESTVACPWHGWRFDVRDGAWCDNRRIKIDVFDVRVEGDEIQVAPIPKPVDEAGQGSKSNTKADSDSEETKATPPCENCSSAKLADGPAAKNDALAKEESSGSGNASSDQSGDGAENE